MFLSALAMLVLLILSETKIVPLGWTWLLLMGTFLTFMTGWLLGTKAADAPAEIGVVEGDPGA